MINGGSTDSIYVSVGIIHIKHISQTLQVMVIHKHIYIIYKTIVMTKINVKDIHPAQSDHILHFVKYHQC